MCLGCIANDTGLVRLVYEQRIKTLQKQRIIRSHRSHTTAENPCNQMSLIAHLILLNINGLARVWGNLPQSLFRFSNFERSV